MTYASSGWVVAVLVLTMGCSHREAAVVCVGERASQLGGATSHFASLVLADGQALRGILRLKIHTPEDDSRECTATLVAENTLLTARHCIASNPEEVEIEWADGSSKATAKPVLHDDLDLAFLLLDEDHPLSGAPPIPISRSSIDWAINDLVQLAGYDHRPGSEGTLVFAVERVEAVTPAQVIATSDGYSGACFGDSGGPLLVVGPNGSVEVAAVLSGGHFSCLSQDTYIRLDAVPDWLDRAPPASVGELPCGAVTRTGACRAGMALVCQDGVLQATACSVGHECGWSRVESGYRCVGSEADSCEGFNDLGACEGEIALKCDGGHLTASPCSLCGGQCVRSPKSGQVTCVIAE